jgi:pyruvate,orthophosphate dikinase
MTHRWVVPLEAGSSEDQSLLGGKGAGLTGMLRLGIPTLPGFVITREAWRAHTPGSKSLAPDLWKEVREALAGLQEETGSVLGSVTDPLVVSVRSSPTVSMPGQLKTVLNVGLNDHVVDSLAETFGDPDLARDAFGLLVLMYGETVHNVTLGGSGEARPSLEELLAAFEKQTGGEFPQDPYVQLERSIAGVFDSWFAEHAREYRAARDIADDEGTAVVVQQMAFGNLGPESGSGVVFTRNPATGEKELYGEYLPGSQGERLVGGHVTPGRISVLAAELPASYSVLKDVCSRLEEQYRDVQDVEFTIEEGRLWILQTRAAARTPLAAVRAGVEMADEGLISRREALLRVDARSVGQVFVPVFAHPSPEGLVAKGIQSSPGAATGQVVFTAEEAKRMARTGSPVILVKEETTADDAAVMSVVQGILTQRGGATSHAAVVARGLGKPCVVGCQQMVIDASGEAVVLGEKRIPQGHDLSIDGTTGEVYGGRREVVSPQFGEIGELDTLLSWADETARVRVYADVSTPAEIEAAAGLGIESIGLCRTERMYSDCIYLPLVRAATLSDSSAARRAALEELRSLHREGFRALLQSCQGRRLSVRLLSAPLDHFLPDRDRLLTEIAELRATQNWSEEIGDRERLLAAIDSMRQSHPQFGLRGIRLLAVFPGLLEAQMEALLQAAADVRAEGSSVDLGILIPFVSHAGELTRALEVMEDVADRAAEAGKEPIPYRVGAVVETPRAAIVAHDLASLVDFLCFDTDSLTDAVMCLSREDSGRVLSEYAAEGLLGRDPRAALDMEGVGSLVRLAVERARTGHPGIEVGAYGSHCLDPAAMSLFDECEMDFVACHLSQLLGARLMAGQQAAERQAAQGPAGLGRE